MLGDFQVWFSALPRPRRAVVSVLLVVGTLGLSLLTGENIVFEVFELTLIPAHHGPSAELRQQAALTEETLTQTAREFEGAVHLQVTASPVATSPRWRR